MSENPQPPETDAPAENPTGNPAEDAAADPAGAEASLEEMLVAGKDGQAQPADIVRAFLTSTVYFLTPNPVDDDAETVNPLSVQDSDGNPLIALFSSEGQFPAEYLEHAPHPVDAPGVALVQSISGAGVIIDPGAEHGFQISAEGMDRIRTDFLEAVSDAEQE